MESRRLPLLDIENHAFWTGGSVGELAICRCQQCGHFVHPPSAACPVCASVDVEAEAVSGRASVVSFSVNHQAWVAGQAVPFVLAMVELDEQAGLWVMSNIVGCEPSKVFIGQRVRVCFEAHDDVWLPMFIPEDVA
ncbi:OB-fold domain-containing protein [Paraburkholderia phymatum]|uniref:Zn-ribbon domain-containing OB-fold protein n=1 Tax=Paraburkholderia phymatum TaxID=148447 RepID=UPI003180035E